MHTNTSVSSLPSNSSLHAVPSTCFTSRTSVFIFFAVFVTNLLLLPVFFFVLYLGYRQWRRQRCDSGAAATRSDLFTHHAVAMQLSEFLGLVFLFCGGYTQLSGMMLVGHSLLKVTATGQAMLHILTCVEHYLAVVRPVTYLHLKRAGEVRIRNILSACVWFLSCGWLLMYFISSDELGWVFYSCITALYLVVIPFCSVSALCALRRPGPGELQAGRSKQRAFDTILAIMAVLLFKFVGNLGGNLLNGSAAVGSDYACAVLMCVVWLDLPSGLVLPLLLLHREGKLQLCKRSS